MHPLALFQFTHDFYFFFLRLQSCQLGDKVLHKYIFGGSCPLCIDRFLHNFPRAAASDPSGAPAAKEETKLKPGKLY